jgi:hypothetical protein
MFKGLKAYYSKKKVGVALGASIFICYMLGSIFLLIVLSIWCLILDDPN